MTEELIASDQKIADLKSKHLKSLANPDGKYTDQVDTIMPGGFVQEFYDT